MLIWITLGILLVVVATIVIGMSLSLRRAELRRFNADLRDYGGRRRSRGAHPGRADR